MAPSSNFRIDMGGNRRRPHPWAVLIGSVITLAACSVATEPTVEEIVTMAAIQDAVIEASAGVEEVAGGFRLSTMIVMGGCTEPWEPRIERVGAHVTVVPRIRLVFQDGVTCPDVTMYEAYRVVVPTDGGEIDRLTLQGFDLHEEMIIEVDAQLPS